LRLDGRQVLAVECHQNQLFAWCAVTTALDSAARLTSEAGGVHRSEAFFSIFFKVDGIKSGMHHPDGLFWIRRPGAEHSRADQPIPLDLVAPMLLREIGIAPPASMRHDRLPEAIAQTSAARQGACEPVDVPQRLTA
jgi:hypothetical protein